MRLLQKGATPDSRPAFLTKPRRDTRLFTRSPVTNLFDPAFEHVLTMHAAACDQHPPFELQHLSEASAGHFTSGLGHCYNRNSVTVTDTVIAVKSASPIQTG